MKKELIKKDLISERGLNRLLHGVSKQRGHRNIEFPITISPNFNTKRYSVTMTYFWSARNFMLLDYIGHIVTNTFYRDIMETDREYDNYIPINPNNPYTNKIEIMIDNQTDDIDVKLFDDNKNSEIILSEKNIRKFYCFNKIPTKTIESLFETTSYCKFTLTYPVRVFNKKIRKYTEVYIPIINENLFDYELSNYNVTPTGRITNKQYKIKFTRFGRLFLYNLKCINFDWISSKIDFYKLPETAQLLYRKYVLCRNGFNDLKFRDSTIISGLGLMNLSKTENIKAINIALDKLKNSNIILDWKYTNDIYEIFKNK